MTSKQEGLIGGMPPLRSIDPPASPWLKPSEEAQKEVEFKQEIDAEPMTKEEVEDEVLKAVEEAKYEDEDEGCVTAISPELYAAVTQAKPERTVSENRALVKALRKADDVHNRTCGKCMKRLPINKFLRLKQSEVCQDCED